MKRNVIVILLMLSFAFSSANHIFADNMYVFRVGIGGVQGTSATPMNINGNLQFTNQIGSALSSTWSPVYGTTSMGRYAIKWYSDPWNTSYKTMWFSSYDGNIRFFTSATPRLNILYNGKIGIGKTQPQYKLDVDGIIHADEFIIDISSGADYVFEECYSLPTLKDVKRYIEENRHLPDVPSADEMQKNGVNMEEYTITLLQKVEELTLYTLRQEDKLNELKDIVKTIKSAQP